MYSLILSIPTLFIDLLPIQYYTTYLLTFSLFISPIHPAISSHSTAFMIGHISMDIVRMYHPSLYFLSFLCGVACFVCKDIAIVCYAYSLLYTLCNCPMHICYLLTTIGLTSSAMYNQSYLSKKQNIAFYTLQTIYLYYAYRLAC